MNPFEREVMQEETNKRLAAPKSITILGWRWACNHCECAMTHWRGEFEPNGSGRYASEERALEHAAAFPGHKVTLYRYEWKGGKGDWVPTPLLDAAGASRL